MLMTRRSAHWLIGLVLTLAASVASGHSLSVFALVDGDTLVVESRFSSGQVPQTGTLRIYDGDDRLLSSHELTGEDTLRLPLPDWRSGLKIQVDTGNGHSNYWILTPDDIRRQRTTGATDR